MHPPKLILMTFNKYYNDLKEDIIPISDAFSFLKNEVLDLKTDKYMKSFHDVLKDTFVKDIFIANNIPENIFTNDKVMDITLWDNVKVLNILDNIQEIQQREKFYEYMYMLVLLETLYYYNDNKKTKDVNDIIRKEYFEMCMMAIQKMEKNEDMYEVLQDMTDDSIKAMLEMLKMFKNTRTNMKSEEKAEKTEKGEEVEDEKKSGESEDPFMNNILNMLQETNIGKFAKNVMEDVSKDINVNEVKSYEDFLQSDKMGKIFTKTMDHFKNMNEGGKFKQDDIVGEISNLINLFGKGAQMSPSTSENSGNSGNSGEGTSNTNNANPMVNPMDIQNIMSLFSKDDKFNLDPSKKTSHAALGTQAEQMKAMQYKKMLEDEQGKQETKERLRKKLENRKKT